MYDYADGKLDWMAAGLPFEGTAASRPCAGDLAHADVPTCTMADSIGSVADRVRAAGFESCLVVNDERVVLGLLREAQLQAGRAEMVGKIMQPGPSTYRPYVDIEEMAEDLAGDDLPDAPITTSNGRLVGLLLRKDAEQASNEQRRSAFGSKDAAQAG